MEQEILAMAKSIVQPAQEDESYLQALCRAQQARLEKRLRKPLTEGDGSTFLCAAAALAAADYYAAKGAQGGASWRAGDVSVSERSGTDYGAVAENLRRAATELLRGLLTDDSFAFLGVRG